VVEVHFARVDRALDATARERLLAMLSDDEHARHARFHVETDRDEYLAAHALVRVALAEKAAVAPETLVFGARDGGKPEVASPRLDPSFAFSLTHARGLVACAVACGTEVGLDAEDLARSTDVDRLEARVLSAHERAALAGLGADARRRRFFETWTLKEAYAKATGVGMGRTFGAVELDLTPQGQARLRVPHAGDDARAWSLRVLDVPPRHVLAVAVRAPVCEVALAGVPLAALAAGHLTPS
jgi:4'-phosphopantetheinyl transferase